MLKVWALFIIDPSIAPISWHSFTKALCSSLLIYLQSLAKSSQVSVSLFSASESVSLLRKWASYRLFDHASLRFAQTDLDERRI